MTQNIENGYCSPLFMEHINRIRQRDSEPGTRKSFCSYCEEAGVYYLSCLIYRGSELYGYIFMISLTDFFPPECHDIVEFIARSISDSLSDRSDSEPVDRRLQGNLFFDMLSGISPGQIDARVRMSGMKIPERMTVISIRSDYWQGKDFPKNVILPGIQRIFPDRPAVLFGRDIAVLADAGDLEENIPGETGRSLALQHFCREHHLHAGFSTPFRNITDVKKHYEEAARAARILQKLKTAPAVSPAHATLLYQMMDKLPGETDFSRFEHPALRELEKYDSEHGTQLLPTLFAFARCNFSLSEASAALFIHRNTMIYRKKRIEQIADIRLDDPETRFEIQVSLAIRNFTE